MFPLPHEIYPLLINELIFHEFTIKSFCPVGSVYRIHWLFLCRGVRIPERVSWYDAKQSDGEVSVMVELWRMQTTPSLPSLPGPFWPQVVVPDKVLSISQIELSCLLLLNWIVWNRELFLTFKLCTYAKLNCLKGHCFFMLNRIVWNRTVLTFKLCTFTKVNCLK